jgi:hypothetical protein
LRQSTVAVLVVATVALSGLNTSADHASSPLEADGIRLRGAWFEQPVRLAVHSAASRLGERPCAALLDEFQDASGRPLRARLRELQLDAPDYALQVLFYDGSSDAPCHRPRVYAFTAPGSRVVRTCPSLGRLAAGEPRLARAVVIHELLHTLGLGENPPGSDEITAAVERRCRT